MAKIDEKKAFLGAKCQFSSNGASDEDRTHECLVHSQIC